MKKAALVGFQDEKKTQYKQQQVKCQKQSEATATTDLVGFFQ
jgi:hypothetical protein